MVDELGGGWGWRVHNFPTQIPLSLPKTTPQSPHNLTAINLLCFALKLK